MWKVLIGASLGGLVGAFTTLLAQRLEIHFFPIGMTYAELAATLLAASALILAALGFFIAVLAVLGWTQFRVLVRKSATDTVKLHIDTRLKDGELRTFLERLTLDFLNEQMNSEKIQEMITKRVDYQIYSSATRGVRDNVDENREE